MVNKELDEKLFDLVLKQAFTDELRLEMKKFPEKEELDQLYTPSPGAERRLRARVRRERNPFSVRKHLKRAAVIMLCVCSAAFGLSLFSPTVQASMKRALMEVFTTHISITFLPEDASGSSSEQDMPELNKTYLHGYQIGYLPEGFTLTRQIVLRRSGTYEYYNEEGAGINFSIEPAEATKWGVDNEGHELESITVNGCEGYLNRPTEPDRIPLLFWMDGEYVLSVEGDISISELFKIAESISQKN